jgi:hypothetical protein
MDAVHGQIIKAHNNYRLGDSSLDPKSLLSFANVLTIGWDLRPKHADSMVGKLQSTQSLVEGFKR